MRRVRLGQTDVWPKRVAPLWGPRPEGSRPARHAKTTIGRHRSRRRRAVRGVLAAALSTALFTTGFVELNLSGAGNAGAASTTTVSLAPVADGYVTSDRPNTVLGFADDVQASSIPSHHKNAYLRFRLPSLSGQTIVSARLVLTRTNHHLGADMALRRVADTTWTENRLTYRAAPRVGSVITSVHTSPAMRTVALNVPRSAFAGSAVSLAVSSPSKRNFVAFRAHESGADGPALKLTVQSGSASSSSSPAPSAAAPSPSRTTSASSSAVSSTAASTVTTSPSAGSGSGCTVSAKLVPSCGQWWGIAPKAHTSTPRDLALTEDEQEARTTFTLMHTYHGNDQLFPNAMERGMAFESGKNRVLLINWKPATDMTWAAVANGKADARIDREANYIKANFPYPFFLTIWHEPENDVTQTAGSGMTASDYAAMFRHVVLRLRSDGATKPVIVMNYMGFDNWALKSWFPKLWPGDDVVDWIGIDPYGSGTDGTYQSGDFNTLVNRKITGFPGYYTWATTNHPGNPIMLCEWGVNEGTNDPYGKADYLDSVSKYLPNYPAIKSLVYFDFDNPNYPVGGSTYLDSSPQSLDTFRRLSDWADAKGPHPTYASGSVRTLG